MESPYAKSRISLKFHHTKSVDSRLLSRPSDEPPPPTVEATKSQVHKHLLHTRCDSHRAQNIQSELPSPICSLEKFRWYWSHCLSRLQRYMGWVSCFGSNHQWSSEPPIGWLKILSWHSSHFGRLQWWLYMALDRTYLKYQTTRLEYAWRSSIGWLSNLTWLICFLGL